MVVRAEQEADDAGTPVTLTLLDAIQQTVKTRELLGEMQQRISSLAKQRGHTRQQVMLDELDREEKALHSSVRVVASEFEKMAKFFSETRMTINGRELLAEDAVKVLMSLKQHLEGLKNLAKNLDLETHGNQILELKANLVQQGVADCVQAWQTEFMAYALLLKGVKIPDSAKDLFNSVWTDRRRVVRVYVKWNEKKKTWVSFDDYEIIDPRLKQFVTDASTMTVMQGIPDGFEAYIECSTDDQGKTRFNIKTSGPRGGVNAAGSQSTSGQQYGWRTRQPGSAGSDSDNSGSDDYSGFDPLDADR